MNLTKKYKFILILIFFLLFLKIDYRIINDLKCCQDDFDYYSHALTISQDFDFDYSNQFNSKQRYYNKEIDKIAPMGFFGSGLLASPFLFIGIQLDNLFNTQQNFLDFKKLLYSFSSIFYLLFSLILLLRITNSKIPKFSLPLALFGSGLAYYAFERFSMPHVYEVFTVTLIIYTSVKFYTSKSPSTYACLIPLSLLLGIFVRWTNYYIFVIPLVVFLLSANTNNNLLKEINFYIFSTFSVSIFLIHTKLIYGIYTFSPFVIYGEESLGIEVYESIFKNLLLTLNLLLKDTIIVLFTQEFGLFWFTPVLFGCLVFILVNYIKFSFKEKLASILVLLSFAQGFYTISIWQSTASSYGFRYIFSIIPLAIYFLYKLEIYSNSNLLKIYLNAFSLFSLLAVLFFETTLTTQLSLSPVLNSFGVEKIYSQPNYLSGVVSSFFQLDSYLKIVATSMLGSIFMKLFLNLFGFETLVNSLKSLGTSNNDDFINLLTRIDSIDAEIFITAILLSVIFVFFAIKYISNKNLFLS